MNIKIKTWYKLYIASTVLMVMLASIAVPLSLAIQDPNVCEMACCVAQERCCCSARRAYVRGHEPGPDDLAIDSGISLANACPGRTSDTVFFSLNGFLHGLNSQTLLVMFTPILHQNYRDQFLTYNRVASQPSSPRAPPFIHAITA